MILSHRNEALRWIDQLKNHPSIIMWVVFNEGWGQHDTVDITNEVMQVRVFEHFKKCDSNPFPRLTPAAW